jgi:hypothetical protein
LGGRLGARDRLADDLRSPSLDTGVRWRNPTILEGDRAISPEAASIGLAGSAAAAVALVTSYSVARFESVRFPALGIDGVDILKSDSPVRAEMGGLAVLIALAAASTVYVGVNLTWDDVRRNSHEQQVVLFQRP